MKSLCSQAKFFVSNFFIHEGYTDLDKIVDDSGAILFGNKKSKKASDEGEEIDAIPLLLNGDGEVFYYKDGKNNLRISYRSWDLEDDEQDE